MSMTREQIIAELAACPEILKPRPPNPITNASAKWSEWEHVHNASLSNMATVAASTYGLPIWNQDTQRHVRNPDRNEFWDDSRLLRFLCVDGKMTKQDYVRINLKYQNHDS